MVIGKVINRVISTRKYDTLQGYKLLVIEPYNGENKEWFVAADTIGAGEGELVLVSFGSAVQHALHQHAPIDAVVVGIVDQAPDGL
ncbi:MULTISPECIES: EutN/CcmL family microcompartment protein [Gracilibacillus]|uniref:Ethanolamine utilization protein EutN n=1 Tax=Gracilibacillus kekensis TaxID=1027249 RepID=A0A1M7QVJ6_9BACI|nr:MULTISPECIES: EutN/CcmL family microcompartment protein [Gracilibacillus]SHN35772.1 ethanolamine utilization protein EutN [Gracilibacillus kekensis]